MIRLAPIWLSGLLMFLLIPSTHAERPSADAANEEAAATASALHVVIKPEQRTLMGPDPFEEPDVFGFRTLGFMGGTIGAIVAGYVIDGAIALIGEPTDAESLKQIDVPFEFHRTILDSIAALGNDAVHLAEIHEFDYGESKRANARRLFKAFPADYVAYFEPTYFISPGLDQIRLVVEIDLYARKGKSNGLQPVYLKRYEYLSDSRGELFRPFRPGEKEVLISEIEAHFDQKARQYPNNVKVYTRDRERAVKAIEKREVIPPPIAMTEGWPGDSLSLELQTATDCVTDLIRDDLKQLPDSETGDGELVTFNGLDLHGEATQFKGYLVGEQDGRSVYRDQPGNVYSLPAR